MADFLNETLCGLFQTFHLTRPSPYYIPVPLTSVHVNVEVVNFCGKVEITHQFINKESNPIECIYFFPVEEEAAVVKFKAKLQEREIETVVKEKEEARVDYNHAVQNRQTAFLMEETKPDVFEMKVGHLSPGEVATITVTYLSELPVEEGKTKLTIPTTVAPRYIPRQVENQELARKLSSIQHDFTLPVKMTMSLAVLMRTKIASIVSPSHQLAIPTKNTVGGFFHSETTFDGNVADMDRDMVIFINSDEPNKPTVIVEKNEDGSAVAMLSFVPQFRLKDQKVEAVFLVDCSGSMNGDSMDLAKEALLVFLHSLPMNSFFNIVRFGSTFEYLYSHSRPYDDNSLREAKISVQRMSADLGGTEIYQPLELILNMAPMAGSPRQVFILTDGQVSNSSACVNLVKKFSNTNRVFTLGVGSSADRHLVKGMARAGQGTSMFTTQGESLTAKVVNQLRNGLQPCITDVNVQWGKNHNNLQPENSHDGVETEKTLFGYGKTKIVEEKNIFSLKHQVPREIGAIYDGTRLLVYKLLDDSISSEDVILIKASTTEGELKLEVPVNKHSFINGNSVHKLFARKMIQYIDENCGQNYKEETKRFITDIGLKYQVASKYTSFVGVDQKQSYTGDILITRQVKNHLPHNSTLNSYGGGGPPFGGFGSGLSHGYSTAWAPHPGSMGSNRQQYQPEICYGSIGSASGALAPAFSGFGCPSANNHFGSQQPPQLLGRAPVVAPPPQRYSLHRPNVMIAPATTAPPVIPAHAKMPDVSNLNHMHEFSFGSSSEPSQGFQESKLHPTSQSNTSSGTISIAKYQAADGSFLPDQNLAQALGTNLQTLLKEVEEMCPSNSQNQSYIVTWVTAVVVCHLKINFQKEKDIWELIVDKAEKWLREKGVGFVSVYLEKAQKFVNSQQKYGRMTITCLSGHTLVEMKDTNGMAWFCNSMQKCVGGCNVGGNHLGMTVWRCKEDWRVTQGGTCDFDICGPCMGQK